MKQHGANMHHLLFSPLLPQPRSGQKASFASSYCKRLRAGCTLSQNKSLVLEKKNHAGHCEIAETLPCKQGEGSAPSSVSTVLRAWCLFSRRDALVRKNTLSLSLHTKENKKHIPSIYLRKERRGKSWFVTALQVRFWSILVIAI